METQTENRQFLEMLKPAKERLNGKSAEEIAGKAHIEYNKEGSEFRFSSMGKEIRVSYPSYDLTPEIEGWHHLVILHYMDMADGTMLSSRLINFGDLADGLVRGGGFDRQSEQTISRFLGDKPEENVKKVCESLGAEIVASNADLCAVFSFLPMYPVTLKIWFADDEMDGAGKLLLDGSADHYLSVEDAVTVGSIVLETVINSYKQMYETPSNEENLKLL